MKCKECNKEMDATGWTRKYPDCNTWTCSSCGRVEPELASVEPEWPEWDGFSDEENIEHYELSIWSKHRTERDE